MADPVAVEMFLDVSCPWCHGSLETSRRLLDELGADPAIPPIELVWRFMRLHEMPREGGLPVEEYYASLYGDEGDAVARAREEVEQYATSVGVRVDPARYGWLHDPFTAHRLLAAARDDGGDDVPSLWSLARVVFTANFCDGVDIADLVALRGAVERGGLWVPQRIWTSLDAGNHMEQPRADRRRAQDVQLDGVPRTFVNGHVVPTWIDPDEIRRQLRVAIAAIVPADGQSGGAATSSA